MKKIMPLCFLKKWLVFAGLLCGACLSLGFTNFAIWNQAAAVVLLNQWTAMTTTNAPTARFFTAATYVNSKMFVWGGTDPTFTTFYNTGGMFDPVANSWTATSTTNAPSGRRAAKVVTVGTKAVVWAGMDAATTTLATGAVYDATSDTWTTITTTNAPTGRSGFVGVSTGSKMIIWGGSTSSATLNTGGIYDPGANTWTTMSTTGAPVGRGSASGVWTGSKLIVWGGVDYSSVYYNNGGIYDPSTDTWTSMSTTNAPNPRRNALTVWTGSKMIVYGGANPAYNSGNPTADGGIYDVASDTWTAISTTGAPTLRAAIQASVVWTGSKMIVWGGWQGGAIPGLNTGAVYDPSTDTWTATTTTSAPSSRYDHIGVWTGTKMLIWSGVIDSSGTVTNTGGMYN